jgi:AcrR family transcriptional regulator
MQRETARPYRQIARAEATEDLRSRIVHAFLNALKARWLDDITLDDVAAEARTTRQTVIRMFGGKEGLLKAAVDIWPAEVEAQVRTPECKTVEALAAAMVGMLEELGDMYLRVLCLAPRYPDLEHFVALGRARHRQWFTDTLRPILEGRGASEIEQIINECLIASDTYSWSLLRHSFGKSVEETVSTITDMMNKAIGKQPKRATKRR